MVGNITDSQKLANQRAIKRARRNASNKNSLTDQEKKILSDLLALHAATPLQFELETNRIGQQDFVVKSLEDLKNRGYVKADCRYHDGYPEIVIYYPSLQTRWLRIIGNL